MALKITGGNGEFRPKSFSGTKQVNIGETGDIITITPPDGQRAKLMWLHTYNSSQSGAANESGITVSGSVQGAIVNNKTLSNKTTTVDSFSVGSAGTVRELGDSHAGVMYEGITGEVDEVLTVNKAGGNTANVIYYSFAYGL